MFTMLFEFLRKYNFNLKYINASKAGLFEGSIFWTRIFKVALGCHQRLSLTYENQ